MKNDMKRILLSAVLLLSALAALAQGQAQPLPNDPAVRVGKLENGLTYYIRHNDKPAQRAEFYLATNAGAINEDLPEQDGLAHFLEHMCFNGLKNLPGKQMLEYLQSIGASFGGNINASTGVEQTQYMLNNIPVIREGIIDTCLLVMHDYSHFVLNDPAEIDAERGVIIEEKRTRNTAGWRMAEKTYSYLFQGSKFAGALGMLIGTEEHLRTFKPESLVSFYRDWYRPDNQAVVVVGDVDVDLIEAKIKALFADIPAVENPRQKDMSAYIVPDNAEPIVGIITDPEANSSSIGIHWKSQALPLQMNNTNVAFLQDLIKDMISLMMQERFTDISSRPNAPFLSAGFEFEMLNVLTEAASGEVRFKDGEGEVALRAFYNELEKMRRFGFNDAEVDRAKKEMVSRYEKRMEGADSRKNAEFVWPLINNFFLNTPYMEPKVAYELVKQVCAVLPSAVFSQVAAQMLTDENQVILYSAPEREGLVPMTGAQMLQIIQEVKSSDIQPDKAVVVAESFLDASRVKGAKAVSEREVSFGATEWTFRNGARVVFLPTEYKKDEVVIDLSHRGGTSLVSDADMPSFEENLLRVVFATAGIGPFSTSETSKMLSGKQVSMSPYVGEDSHGISGRCAPKDFEAALQILYLDIVKPRFDQAEFDQGMQKIAAMIPNLEADPSFAFQQEAYKVLYGGNVRHQLIGSELLKKASLKTIEKNYRKLLGGVDGAVVYIVGNLDKETVKALCEKYIGALPKGRKSAYKALPDPVFSGRVEKRVEMAMQAPKTSVMEAWTAKAPYSVADAVAFSAVEDVLDMVYTETLREEEGGTYGAGVSAAFNRLPEGRMLLQVFFDTNVEQAPRLMELAREGLEKLAQNGPDADKVVRVQENLKKRIPEQKINNRFWLKSLARYYDFGEDYPALYEEAVAALDAALIQRAAQALLAPGNTLTLSLWPKE